MWISFSARSASCSGLSARGGVGVHRGHPAGGDDRAGTCFGLVLGPAVSLGPAPDDADAVLACSSESVLRLFAGRLDAAHTPGDLTLTGDRVTLDQLRATFSGF